VGSHEPLIIELAINGMTTRERNPKVPRHPEEIGEEALACFAEGAAIVHAHNDRIDLPLDEAVDAYAQTWEPVLRQRPDALWCPTQQAFEPTMAERIAHYEPLARRAGLRIGMIDPGCVNVTWPTRTASRPDSVRRPTPLKTSTSASALRRARSGYQRVDEPTWLNHTPRSRGRPAVGGLMVKPTS
jgi:hypothetical protein